jgi:hypothetical protein
MNQGTAKDINAVLGHISLEPFDINLSSIGCFGKGKSARAVLAGVKRSDILTCLQHKIETPFRHKGLPAGERKYTPHITLARLHGTPVRRLEAYIAYYGVCVPQNDPGGERLRDWLDITPDNFCNESKITVIPIGFYYPMAPITLFQFAECRAEDFDRPIRANALSGKSSQKYLL